MSIFTQLLKSLYSPKEMALFRFQKMGKTILYIMLLTLLVTIPKAVAVGDLIKEGTHVLNQMIDEEMPDFKIEDGKLTADITEPIVQEENNFTFVLDPNATDISNYKKQDGIFILQDKMIVVDQQGEQPFSYSEFGITTLEKKDLQDFVSTIDGIYPILTFVIGILIYLFWFMFSFIGISLLAFIGSAMNGKRKLSYKQNWILTTYSHTIPIVFFMIMDFLKVAVPGSFFIFIGVVLIVLYLTIKEIPQPKEKIEQ
ncbi:hypothetical protein BAMA_22245 [Bacillus manliponensis]|uniref:DUF1189 domain-containing protein n=1 Tax=Bacillus manliponensis TaxID=574376 RepID=A0A073JZA5_9BACI|nr:DUF1189 domain-containing protein [Bacillus manliponensis]KEK19517.1 hypothetical protein BAMA_22245 [Bacillus manliponensis]